MTIMSINVSHHVAPRVRTNTVSSKPHVKLHTRLRENFVFNCLISWFKQEEGTLGYAEGQGCEWKRAVLGDDSKSSSVGASGVINVTRSPRVSPLHSEAGFRGIRTQIPAGKIIKYPNQIATANKQFNSTQELVVPVAITQ